MIHFLRRLRWAGGTAVLLGMAAPAAAQNPPVTDARLDTRRAQATRPELLASLAQIDTILGSPGYSSRIREAKRREAALIRDRLDNGDLRVGDQVQVNVLNEQQYSVTVTIQAGQVLSVPGLPDLSMRGVLRSEAEGHITSHIAKFVRDPTVRVVTSINLAILGAVGKQGFYQVPADVRISDAIMLAGGPTGAANPNRSRVVRSNSEILGQTDVEQAIAGGATLDQLNLRAGDQILVDERTQRGARPVTILSLLGVATSVGYLLTRIF